MISSELIAYVRLRLAAGASKEIISKALSQSGWTLRDIAEAFEAVVTEPPAPVPKSQPSFIGRKILLSFGVIIASAVYASFQYAANPVQTLAAVPVPKSLPVNTPVPDSSSVPPKQSQGNTVKQTPAKSVPPPTASTPVSTPTPQTPPVSPPPTPPTPTPTPVPTPAPTPKPAGQYADGSYIGNAADAYYGLIQVKAIIQGGKIVDVQFLQYPNDRRTSQMINSQAMPMLTSEAIQVQNANVDIVSGATDSSMAFQQSLGSALAQAKI